MTDLAEIKRAARLTSDENGAPVVQIPLELWQEFVGEVQPQPSQIERINALLGQWENEPDDTPEAWWDEFDNFIKNNRVNFEERDLGLGKE